MKYVDKYKAFNNWKPMNLRGPKPRTTRKLEAVEKAIKTPEINEIYIGGIVGEYIIKATDGHRALLVYGEPKEGAKTFGFIEGLNDEVEITDPEFYNAFKRVKLATHTGHVELKIKPDEKIIRLSANGLIDDLFEIAGEETVDITPGNKTTEAKFVLDAKYVLDALGNGRSAEPRPAGRAAMLAGAALLALGAFLSVLQILPEPDNSFTGRSFFSLAWDPVRFRAVMSTVLASYLPIPEPARI